ncbi:hypothetical protein ACN73F_005273, partial [Escherichia coli]
FTGNTLTVEVDGKEVKEITQWANPITTVSTDGIVCTELDLTINYTEDNFLDYYLFNNELFKLSIKGNNKEQYIHEGYFKIVRREVLGDKDTVVLVQYRLESYHPVYPFGS